MGQNHLQRSVQSGTRVTGQRQKHGAGKVQSLWCGGRPDDLLGHHSEAGLKQELRNGSTEEQHRLREGSAEELCENERSLRKGNMWQMNKSSLRNSSSRRF